MQSFLIAILIVLGLPNARAGVTTGGPALTLPKQCKVAMLGGKPHELLFMTGKEANALRAVYDNSGLAPLEKINQAFSIWRAARARSFGWYRARRIWKSYETSPRNSHYGLPADAELNELATHYPLNDTVFGLMTMLQNLEHRIRILKELDSLPAEHRPEPNVDVYILEVEWEVAGTLPTSAFDSARAAIAKIGDPVNPKPEDLERQRRARVYLNSWSQAARMTRGEYRLTSPRAEVEFTRM